MKKNIPCFMVLKRGIFMFSRIFYFEVDFFIKLLLFVLLCDIMLLLKESEVSQWDV